MSPTSSTFGVPVRKNTIPIRPAIPLIYEPKEKKASRRVKEASDERSREDGTPSNAQNLAEEPTKKFGEAKLAGEEDSELRAELVNDTQPRTNDLKQKNTEKERAVPEVTETITAKYGEYRRTDQEEVEESSKTLRSESAGELELANNENMTQSPSGTAKSVNHAIAIKGGNCTPQSMQREQSPVDNDLVEGVSVSPQPSLGPRSEAASQKYPPEGYQCSYDEDPDYTGKTVEQKFHANGWIMPPNDPRRQANFTQGWFSASQLNGVGGLPPPTPSASVDDRNPTLDPKLVEHIFSSFNDKRYADVRLIISQEKAQFEETTFYLHSVLISRSETLRGLIDAHPGDHDPIDKKKVVQMRLNDRFITPIAFEIALRTCYGQQASIFLDSKYKAKMEGRPDFLHDQSITDMQELLALVAAGQFLKLEDVVLQTLEKAQKILEWDNLQYAMSFGLESSYHRRNRAEAALLRPFACSTSDGDWFTLDCARYLLDISLIFMINSFPDTWVFDKTAKPLPLIDRLPSEMEISCSRNSRSKLARIQFGQRSPERDPDIADRDALISSIVLSIPTAQLRVIASARISSMVRVLSQIIEEREQRRLAAWDSNVPWDRRRLAKETEWYAVGFRESLTRVSLENDDTLDLSRSPVSIYRTIEDEEAAKQCDASEQHVPGNPNGVI